AVVQQPVVESIRGTGEEEGGQDDEIEGGYPGQDTQVDEAQADQTQNEVDPPYHRRARLDCRSGYRCLGHHGDNISGGGSDSESEPTYVAQHRRIPYHRDRTRGESCRSPRPRNTVRCWIRPARASSPARPSTSPPRPPPMPPSSASPRPTPPASPRPR